MTASLATLLSRMVDLDEAERTPDVRITGGEDGDPFTLWIDGDVFSRDRDQLAEICDRDREAGAG